MYDIDLMRQVVEAQKDGSGKFTRRMVIAVSNFFGEQPMDMVKILERNGLLKRGSWDWFKRNGGITEKHIEESKQGKLL